MEEGRKVWVDEKFGWRWDEEGEVLRDEKGTVREEIQREER